MKKFNFIYWILAPLLISGLFLISKKLRISYKEYFGYAENRHSEINLDKEVIVSDIYVQMGQHVKKGQPLMKVSNQDMNHEVSQLNINLEGVRRKEQLTEAEIRADILELTRQRDFRLSELNTRIQTAEADIQFYKALTPQAGESGEKIHHPKEEYIQQLTEEVKQTKNQYDHLINHYHNTLTQPKETQSQANLLRKHQQHLTQKMQEFEVVAPYDGIIGNANVKEGEFVPAFSSLISFYETTPPIVLAFVQERYDIKVGIGDSVLVQSVYNPTKKVNGVVSAKGHRIVEIPEKLRKIPDLKIYGVEVFIQIPHDNKFLQFEVLKVSPVSS